MNGRSRGRGYLFHGVPLTISGADAVLDVLSARLRHFPPAAPDAAGVRFEFVVGTRGTAHVVTRPSGQARPLVKTSDQGFHLEYFESGDLLYGAYRDEVRMLCDVPRATVRVSLATADSRAIWTAAHPAFVLALFELLKRQGLFNVHASAVAESGRAILLAGHSGAGKSTLALALCRAGFAFMSDDYVFLTRRPEGLRILGFPEDVDVFDETVGLFPGLETALEPRDTVTGWKRRIPVDGGVRLQPAWEASPAVLVFPTVSKTSTSRLDPIDTRDALAHLVSNVQFTDPRLAQSHVDVLAALIRECDCYQLSTGRDFDALPGLLRSLLSARV